MLYIEITHFIYSPQTSVPITPHIKRHTGWHVLQRAWLKPHINTHVFSHNLLGRGANGYFTSEDNVSTLNGALNNRAHTHTHTHNAWRNGRFSQHILWALWLARRNETGSPLTSQLFYFFLLSDGSNINMWCYEIGNSYSMQFPSVSCKGEIVLISECHWKCTWARTHVYYILRACPSQGHTSNGRPVSQLVAGLNWRMSLVPFPFLPSCKRTLKWTHHPPESIHQHSFVCLLC